MTKDKWVGPLRVALCAFAFVTISASFDAHASPQSKRLVGEGLTKMKARDVVGAAILFGDAYKADSKDGRAAFYLGVALNRLGQHGAALTAFQRMWDLGLSHPELGFEGGWAALARRQFKTAVTLLEPYVKKNPKNAKALEFLGRAYIGVGKLDEAEAALNKALSLDPKLTPTVLFALGNIADLRGDRGKADALLTQIVRERPDSRLGSVLRSRLVRKGPRKPWFLSFALSGGYNDNPIGLPHGAVLPSDLSSKDSIFIRGQIDAGYTWRIDETSAVNAGYGLVADVFTDIDNFDSQGHRLFAEYSRRLAPDLIGAARVFGAVSFVDADRAVSQVGVEPSLTYRWNPKNITDVRYSLSYSSYAGEGATKALDRDAKTHVITLAHSIFPMGLRLRAGVYQIINVADGGDFDYSGTGVFGSAGRELFWKVNGDVSISKQWDGYDNLNSLTGGGFLSERHDRITRFSLQLSRLLPESLVGDQSVTVFGRFNFNDNDSDVTFFDYTQRVVNVGVSANF